MRPDPWPSPGTVTTDLDICSWSASQLEGEQNIHLPTAGSKLHATPSARQHFSFSPSHPVSSPLGTLARKNLSCEEGAATEQRATEAHRPEPWEPPDAQAEDLHE